jgi:hypothetical protein
LHPFSLEPSSGVRHGHTAASQRWRRILEDYERQLFEQNIEDFRRLDSKIRLLLAWNLGFDLPKDNRVDPRAQKYTLQSACNMNERD